MKTETLHPGIATENHRGCCCGHSHTHTAHSHHGGAAVRFLPECFSLAMLLVGLIVGQRLDVGNGPMLVWYLAATLPVGWPILKETAALWRRKDIMNEFTLMLLAAIGAFAIGEYPEGVAVLLFYSFGEKFQERASDDVRRRIRELVERMPANVTVEDEGGVRRQCKPEEVAAATRTVVRPGERVPIDGTLLGSEAIDFDSSAITGESVPMTCMPGAAVRAGMIPIDREAGVFTTTTYANSTMSRMMKMIEDASAHKTPTETMLRRITRWFTPAVVTLAATVFVVPALVSAFGGAPFEAEVWLRRSLVFLVCSCPCALVVSIPLAYFASLGAAARRGILFKGASHIDRLREVDTVLLDKTGTVTTGKFRVVEVLPAAGADRQRVLALAAACDRGSAHPLAVAIVEAAEGVLPSPTNVQSIPHGMRGELPGGGTLLVGSLKLMQSMGIEAPQSDEALSQVCVALDGRYLGSVMLEDAMRPEAVQAVAALRKVGVKDIRVLSGDREGVVAHAAAMVGADSSIGAMLPEEKYSEVNRLRSLGRTVAFVGDGINDAPSIASADIGVAMGTLGTDMAVESADMVIVGDRLDRLPEAVALSRRARRVVMENVCFAFGVKGSVMLLAAFGAATLWAGVFADTGVTLITILWTLLRLRR